MAIIVDVERKCAMLRTTLGKVKNDRKFAYIDFSCHSGVVRRAHEVLSAHSFLRVK